MAKKKPAKAEPPFINLPPGEVVVWERRADPRVRDILLSVAELTRAEGDSLCLWLQYYLHPNWILIPAGEAARVGREVARAEAAAKFYASKIRPELNRERNSRIIKLWAGGPKVKGGRSAGQVLLELEEEYPTLNKEIIGQVVQRHKARKEERDAIGM